jgi:hypothetical protein
MLTRKRLTVQLTLFDNYLTLYTASRGSGELGLKSKNTLISKSRQPSSAIVFVTPASMGKNAGVQPWRWGHALDVGLRS